MLFLAPWIAALWLRLERHRDAQVDGTRRLEHAFWAIPAARMAGDGQAYDCAAHIEQTTGNREHDDRVRRLKVEALHAFKRDFARR